MDNIINERENTKELIAKLEKYDIISFDIFDTLILRPFKNPTDLFRILGIKHNIVNFYETRRNAEKVARANVKKKYGHTEVTIYDIYEELNITTDLDINVGVDTEFKAEKDFCYANPYMKEVFDELIKMGKEVIIVSDMYIPHDMMKELLENCGYTGYSKLFVSCDYGMTKRNGYLYKYVLDNYIKDRTVIHVGDNKVSDINSANANNIETHYYKRNGEIGSEICSVDMSPTIGSLYKGVVSNYINNGINKEKTENVYYKYGFLYSGILIYGYVNWIHKYAKDNGLDKILFLARDGYILKKVYDLMFDDIPSEYCLWSRHAVLKTIPEKDLPRYIWQLIDRISKNNEDLTIAEVINYLKLDFLENEFHIRNISLETRINKNIIELLRTLIYENKDKVKSNSKIYNDAAKKYYLNKIGKSTKVGIVDLGWRGSGAIALKELFCNYWNFDCEVKSLIAFGITRKAGFDDGFVLIGATSTYAFSEYANYDFSKEFQKKLLLNMSLIEILISSAPKPSFLDFEFDEKGNVVKKFDREETENYEIINALHAGIIDFAIEYKNKTKGYRFLQEIPSRDAVAPLMSLLSENNYEKFAKDFKNFYYTYLVAGTNSTNLVSFYDVYKEERRKQEEKALKLNQNKKANKRMKKQKNKHSSKVTKIFNRIKRMWRNNETRVRYYYAKCFEKRKVLENTILAQSYAGDNFSGNPYYMIKEIYKKEVYGNYKIYVSVKKENVKRTKKMLKTKKLNRIKVVKINSRKYAKLLSQAKYLINNVAFPMYFIKKKEQVYINTWHGTPLKGLGKSIKDAPHESGNYQRNFLMVDYFIMPNTYTCEIIKNDYMINNIFKGEYIVSGYPRNSIFYNEKQRNELKEKLGLKNKKVLVYMPTWRRAVNGKHENQINIIYSLINTISENLNDDEVLYIKLHNLVRNGIDVKQYKNVKLFPTDYETYEFLNIADCLITDYSSVMFDYANVNKKIILYAYDEKEYMNGRSIYTSIHDMPFEIAKTEQEVIKGIKAMDEYKDYKEFKDKYCYGESLDLCGRICEYIFLGNNKDLIIQNEAKIRNDNVLVYVGNLAKTYKREMIFNILNKIPNKENIFVNFYRKRSAKNKLFINEFSDKFKYINMQGEKVLTITEAIANILYTRLNIKGKWIDKKIDSIYEREAKRLFPNLKFEKVVDMIGNSAEIIKLYSHIKADEREIYIINNNIYKLNKWKKIKAELTKLNDKFSNIYLEEEVIDDEDITKVKVAKQEKENLFQNKENVMYKDIKEIFNIKNIYEKTEKM